ncbi:MAG TPA: TauD/TfdA family dioxygenase [Pyrinomonadaceae bacterium]|nr:TauD/TfdA family dioxygenase [Pyrinomonadaceae bacterium]
MKTNFPHGERLPAIVEPDAREADSPEALLRACREHEALLRRTLHASGALLLRGFAPLAPEEFAACARLFAGRDLLDYAGGVSPRDKLGAGVYTSTEYPSRLTLPLHNELSYAQRWPELLFFYCVQPAASGGETRLADSRSVLKNLDAEVVRRFKSKGVMYVRNLHDGAGARYSWQEAFETDDRAVVEEHCRAGGMEFAWRADGGLRLREIRPATAVHPQTGEEVWFNQADGFHPSALDPETYAELRALMPEDEFRLNSFYGDGAPLDAASLAHVREVVAREEVRVSWRAGDVLVVDNLLACHGRMPFEGQRKVVLAMA